MAHFAEVRTDTHEVLRVLVINNKDVDANGGDYSEGAETWVTNLMSAPDAQSESIKEIYGGRNPGVSGIYSTQRAFAALKNNGTCFTWGDHAYGGNINFSLTEFWSKFSKTKF